MHNLALLLACSALAGYGRPQQVAIEPQLLFSGGNSRLQVVDIFPILQRLVEQHTFRKGSGTDGTLSPSTVFALLLRTFKPASAFNAYSGVSVGNPCSKSQCQLDHQVPLICMSDQTFCGGVPDVQIISSAPTCSPRISKDAAYERAVRDAWDERLFYQPAPEQSEAYRHERIVYSVDGDVMHGLLVHPKRVSFATDNGCGVVIVHTAVGPHDIFLHWKAESLAALGYTVLIADLFGDEDGSGWEQLWSAEARRPLARDRGLLRRRVYAAVNVLGMNEYVEQDSIAAIGYCFGGRAVLDLARMGVKSGVKAVVSFHGILDDGVLPAADMSRGPRVLICHGDLDPFVDEKSRGICEAQLRRNGAQWEMIVFGGARHGFTNPAQALNDNPSFGYDLRAAEKSWKAMTQLFDELFFGK